MFFIFKPRHDTVLKALEKHRDSPYTYPCVGSTFSGDVKPRGYSINKYEKKLGSGRALFKTAVDAVASCAMYRHSFTGLVMPDETVKPVPGTTMAVVARHFLIWSVNPIRVVYAGERCDNDDDVYMFAVGTLPGHEERGEERFTVRHTRNGEVFYELFSFYKPARIILRLAYPAVQSVLRQFDRESAKAVAAYCDRILKMNR